MNLPDKLYLNSHTTMYLRDRDRLDPNKAEYICHPGSWWVDVECIGGHWYIMSVEGYTNYRGSHLIGDELYLEQPTKDEQEKVNE